MIIHPTALLVFQQLSTSSSSGPVRRNAKLRFFAATEWIVIGAVGTVITAVIFGGYHYALGPSVDVAHARAMALVALLVASATVTGGLAGLNSRTPFIAISLTLIPAIIPVQIEPVSLLLHMNPLHLKDWLAAAGVGLVAGIGASMIPLRQGNR